jgi:hypothetical protein
LVEFSSVSTISWSCYGILWSWSVHNLSEFFFKHIIPHYH